MSVMSSLKIGALTQKLLLLSVAEKAVCSLSGASSARRLYCLIPPQPSEQKPAVKQQGVFQSTTPRLIHTSSTDYSTSFFVKHTAAQIWKGVTSVSNAGRKRGRGKGVGKKTSKDLNRGQVIGVGKANILWPGLNSPVIQGKELVERRKLPPDPDREAKLIKLRDTMGRFRPLLLSPLERGWSGTKMHGRKIGPPDPIGQDTFDDFDTVVLEMKTVTNMDANFGRVKRFSVMTFTGNKNGLAGFGLAKCPDGRRALKRAKNRAGQRLVYIERFNEHTVLHDFVTEFGATKIMVFKKPEGFGLVCHRAIKSMCEMIGIKDIYCKVEGSTNVQHIIKSFMLGLIKQKTHQQLAEEKGLYLVEQRQDHQNYPEVVAAPRQCRTEKEIPYDETLDFQQICFGGRIPSIARPYQPFYKKLPSWENHLLKTEWRRNQPEVRRYLLREYNGMKNHFTSKYPEVDGTYGIQLIRKQIAEREAAEQDET